MIKFIQNQKSAQSFGLNSGTSFGPPSRKAFLMPQFLIKTVSIFLLASAIPLSAFAVNVNMDDPNLNGVLASSAEQRSSLNAASCDFNCPECMKANPMCGNSSFTDTKPDDILNNGTPIKSKDSKSAQ
jgi:hypothetical protein